MANQPVPQTADISIHALRKESDKPFAKKFRWNAISIHALRKESDTFPHDLTPSKRFQSTLSVRRATPESVGKWRNYYYFNPRSP